MNTPVFGEPPEDTPCVERPAAVLYNGPYFLPGGGSDPGETPEETIHREIREELCREVRLLQPLGTAIQYFPADGVHYRMTATFYHGEFSTDPSGIGEHELAWVPVSDVESTFRHACHVWAVNRAARVVLFSQ